VSAAHALDKLAALAQAADECHGGSQMLSYEDLTLHICCCSFKKSSKKIPGKGGLRFYKNVGLGYKTPRDAIEGASVR